MNTPYTILAVTEQAGDDEIKRAYLAMVRRFPPERFPDDFQRVYQAFEQIKTAEARLSYRLFHCALPEPEDIADLLLAKEKPQLPVSREQWQKSFAADLQQFCRELKL